MIKLINARVRNEFSCPVISIDRSTGLGNPYVMVNENMREQVCEKYDVYFYNNLITNFDISIEPARKGFYHDLLMLVKANRSCPKLYCWCSPKRCHGQTLIKFLEEGLKKVKPVNGCEYPHCDVQKLDDTRLCELISRMRIAAYQGITISYSLGHPETYNTNEEQLFGGDALSYLGYPAYWNEYLKRLRGQ